MLLRIAYCSLFENSKPALDLGGLHGSREYWPSFRAASAVGKCYFASRIALSSRSRSRRSISVASMALMNPSITIPYLGTTPLRADKSYANDWLWRVVNIGLLFELLQPS